MSEFFLSADRAHYVYLFKVIGTDTYKIGLTTNVKSRVKEYHFIGIEMRAILYARFIPLINDVYHIEYVRKKAFKLETFFCDKFKDKVIRGREWFRLSEQDVSEIRDLLRYLCDVTADNTEAMSVMMVTDGEEVALK